MFTSNMELDQELRDFVKAKASLELIAMIGEMEEPRHVDLRHRIHVSSSTLTDRLKTGVQHDIWAQQLLQEDDGTAKQIYELTQFGETLYNNLQEYDLPEKYEERRRLKDTISHAEIEFYNEIGAGPETDEHPPPPDERDL